MRTNLAYASAMRASSGRSGTLSLAWAKAALRLGDAEEALAACRRAEADGLDEKGAFACAVLSLHAQRLARRFDEMAEAVARLPEAVRASPKVQWEILAAACTQAGDYRPLAVAVHKDKPHYEPTNLCFATLYNVAADRLIDRGICPKLETVIRRRDLPWQFDQELVGFARVADRLTEEGTDPALAEGELCAALERTGRCATIEEELMVWAVAARFFARAQEFRLSSLALVRYRAMSWALSGSKSSDALGVATSLMERGWFREAHSA
jgi:hypothetical protein